MQIIALVLIYVPSSYGQHTKSFELLRIHPSESRPTIINECY